jgi:hypothetical protein
MRTWSEHVDAVAARASSTERARRRLADMVNIDGLSIAAAAVEFGVGWHTAHAAVADYTDPMVVDPHQLEGVAGIGVDEKRFSNATATRRTVFTTQIVDLDRQRLLDVIEGRSRDVLALRAHLDVELGIDAEDLANPWTAAASSAISFCMGGNRPAQGDPSATGVGGDSRRLRRRARGSLHDWGAQREARRILLARSRGAPCRRRGIVDGRHVRDGGTARHRGGLIALPGPERA